MPNYDSVLHLQLFENNIKAGLGHPVCLRSPRIEWEPRATFESDINDIAAIAAAVMNMQVQTRGLIGAESLASRQAPSLRLLPFPPRLAFWNADNGG